MQADDFYGILRVWRSVQVINPTNHIISAMIAPPMVQPGPMSSVMRLNGIAAIRNMIKKVATRPSPTANWVSVDTSILSSYLFKKSCNRFFCFLNKTISFVF